jgi:hypothetical protein
MDVVVDIEVSDVKRFGVTMLKITSSALIKNGQI